jgi:hypothetical protein
MDKIAIVFTLSQGESIYYISLTTITLYLGEEKEEDAAVLYLMSSNSSFLFDKRFGPSGPQTLSFYSKAFFG